MYTEELNNIVIQIRQRVNPKQIKESSSFIKPFIDKIKMVTDFLPITANCSERLYCIEYNIDSVQICKHCQSHPVKYWNGSYLTYCCKRCARPDAINKMKQTCIHKYNTPWASQTLTFRNRVKSTIKSKYGIDNLFKNKDLIKQSMISKFGVSNPMHDIDIKNRCISSRIKHHGNMYLPNIGNNEIKLLNEQEILDNCIIDRNFKVGMYNPDGYCKDTNTIYEVYEKYHTYTKQHESDIKRQSYIQKHLKCNFVIIWDNSEKTTEHFLYNREVDLEHHSDEKIQASPGTSNILHN